MHGDPVSSTEKAEKTVLVIHCKLVHRSLAIIVFMAIQNGTILLYMAFLLFGHYITEHFDPASTENT